MKILSTLWGVVGAKWQPLIVAFAFSCAVSLAVGAYQLGRQGERLKTVVETNERLIKSADDAEAARDAEQKNAVEMQTKLDLITGSSEEANRRLRELERNNAEIKEFMAVRTPDAARGLLVSKP